jgi:hypothetical protein
MTTNHALASHFKGNRAAILAGLHDALSISVVITFVVVPNTSTRIFKAFLCTPFEYDGAQGELRRYVHDDLGLRCDSQEYGATHSTAAVMMIVWPIAVPLAYALLLWANHNSYSGYLERSAAFLSGDCNRAVGFKPTTCKLLKSVGLTFCVPAADR